MLKIKEIIIIFFLILLLFLFNLNVNSLYHSDIVPSGDPFSYTINLITLHKNLLDDYIYWAARTFVSSQWYYAYKLPLVIFAKIIPYETFFYYFINYFYLFIFIVSFVHFLQQFQDSFKKNVVISFLIAIGPFLTGFTSPISLNLLQLDTQFFLLSLSYFALFLAFLKKQELFTSLLIAGVGGLFIWSRGNSIFYFSIISFFPILFYLLGLKNKTIYFNFLYLAIPVLTILIFFSWYMIFTFDALVEYYSYHAKLQMSYKYSLASFIKTFFKIFVNYPGRFLTQEYNLVYYISFLINAFLLIFLLGIIFIEGIKNKFHLYYNFLLICFLTYFFILIFLTINMGSWLDKNIYVDHAKITMLVPIICIFGILVQFIFQKIKINSFVFIICIILIFLQHNRLNRNDYNNLLSSYDEKYPNLVKPIELENFAINIFKETNNKKIGILWYSFYNPPIIDFYRLKNKLPAISMHSENVNWVIYPIPVGNPEQIVSREKFKEYFKNVINEYDYLIMPLNFKDYSQNPNLLISKYHKETLDVLNESQDKFLPIKILNDAVIKLVLLKKIKQNNNQSTNYYPNIDESKVVMLPNDRLMMISKLNHMQELFDSNLSTFYEKKYFKEIELEISLKEDFLLSSYSFEFGNHFPESISRMPKNWKIKAYNKKEKNWITLDEKKNYLFKKDDYFNYPLFNLKNTYISDTFKIIIINDTLENNIIRIYNLKLSNGDKYLNNYDILKTKLNLNN
jgi:hypothetical protein